MSELDQLDEERTRTATLLSLFQNIILFSPACSKKSLCALFLCLDEENKHIDCDLITRVSVCTHFMLLFVVRLFRSTHQHGSLSWLSLKSNHMKLYKDNIFPSTGSVLCSLYMHNSATLFWLFLL